MHIQIDSPTFFLKTLESSRIARMKGNSGSSAAGLGHVLPLDAGIAIAQLCDLCNLCTDGSGTTGYDTAAAVCKLS